MIRTGVWLLMIALGNLTLRAEMRTWTSQAGSSIEAEYVKVENGKVWLANARGRTIQVPFQSLSEADQAVTKELYSAAVEKEKLEKEKARAALLEKFKPGSIKKYNTSDESKTSYHVYIPTSFDLDAPPPLVYAFSPGGNGRGQLNAMKKSAEKAGWIVVGCDKLKNGNEDDTPIEDAIFASVQEEIPHDPERVYLSGMSGGAMRSYGITARRSDLKFAGILAFGGWMGGKKFQDADYPKGLAVVMINGDNDKGANGWIESDSKVLKKRNWDVKVIHFPGGHKMAPSDVIDEGIAWLIEQQ